MSLFYVHYVAVWLSEGKFRFSVFSKLWNQIRKVLHDPEFLHSGRILARFLNSYLRAVML